MIVAVYDDSGSYIVPITTSSMELLTPMIPILTPGLGWKLCTVLGSDICKADVNSAMDDICKVASQYGHGTFLCTVESGRNALKCMEECLNHVTTNFEACQFGMDHSGLLSRIRSSPVFCRTSHSNSKTEITLDSGRSIKCGANADVYEAYWHICHPGELLISSGRDALSTPETLHAVWTSDAIKEEVAHLLRCISTLSDRI